MHNMTQGPWEVREHDGLYAVAGPAEWVATIDVDELGHLATMDGQEEAVNRANAYAIAAAPDLWEVLEKLLALEHEANTGDFPIDYDKRYLRILEEARDVIAKARGETP